MRTSWVSQLGRPALWAKETKGTRDCAMHTVDGKIHVFSGTTSKAKIGCAVLDLATEKWNHLSIFARIPPADYDVPGPRKYVASWVDGEDENMYLLQGMMDREALEMFDQAHTSRKSHGYDDCWT